MISKRRIKQLIKKIIRKPYYIITVNINWILNLLTSLFYQLLYFLQINDYYYKMSGYSRYLITNKKDREKTVVLNKYLGLSKEVIIPKKYKGIEVLKMSDYCFAFNKHIQKVVIPDTIKNIPDGAFLNCLNLEEINLPNSLKDISFMAFRRCRSLQRILIPENTEYIYDEAFMNCYKLEEAILPDTVKYFGKKVFRHCFNIEFKYLIDGEIKENLVHNGKELKLVLNKMSKELEAFYMDKNHYKNGEYYKNILIKNYDLNSISSDGLYELDFSNLNRFYKKSEHNIVSNIDTKSRYTLVNGTYFSNSDDLKNNIRIVCCGDILCETEMCRINYNKENKIYDFSNIFKYVTPIIKESDFAIANLETLLSHDFPYTGELPSFEDVDRKKLNINAPDSFIDEVKKAGFDMLAMANNHNVDWVKPGVEQTLDKVDKRNIIRTGLFKNEEEKRYAIINIKGIKVAVLAYSTWFNNNEKRLTNLGKEIVINRYDSKKVCDDISNAKADGAEYIMVYMHWGIFSEYRHKESDRQKQIAKTIAKCGADIIMGSHPHAVQGVEYIKTQNRITPVVYSMGNFSTSDYEDIALDNIIVFLDIYREADNLKSKLSFLPCHVFKKFNKTEYYPIVPVNYSSDDLSESERTILSETNEKITRIIS